MVEDSDTREKGPPDWILLGAVVALIALGLMMVYSSSLDVGYREYGDSAYFFKRQQHFIQASDEGIHPHHGRGAHHAHRSRHRG